MTMFDVSHSIRRRNSRAKLAVILSVALLASACGRRQETLTYKVPQDLKWLRSMIDEFHGMKGRWPADAEELYSWMRGERFLNSLTPTDPWGFEYHFVTGPKGIERVFTLGRDGVPGGDDRDRDVFDSDVVSPRPSK